MTFETVSGVNSEGNPIIYQRPILTDDMSPLPFSKNQKSLSVSEIQEPLFVSPYFRSEDTQRMFILPDTMTSSDIILQTIFDEGKLAIKNSDQNSALLKPLYIFNFKNKETLLDLLKQYNIVKNELWNLNKDIILNEIRKIMDASGIEIFESSYISAPSKNRQELLFLFNTLCKQNAKLPPELCKKMLQFISTESCANLLTPEGHQNEFNHFNLGTEVFSELLSLENVAEVLEQSVLLDMLHRESLVRYDDVSTTIKPSVLPEKNLGSPILEGKSYEHLPKFYGTHLTDSQKAQAEHSFLFDDIIVYMVISKNFTQVTESTEEQHCCIASKLSDPLPNHPSHIALFSPGIFTSANPREHDISIISLKCFQKHLPNKSQNFRFYTQFRYFSLDELKDVNLIPLDENKEPHIFADFFKKNPQALTEIRKGFSERKESLLNNPIKPRVVFDTKTLLEIARSECFASRIKHQKELDKWNLYIKHESPDRVQDEIDKQEKKYNSTKHQEQQQQKTAKIMKLLPKEIKDAYNAMMDLEKQKKEDHIKQEYLKKQEENEKRKKANEDLKKNILSENIKDIDNDKKV